MKYFKIVLVSVALCLLQACENKEESNNKQDQTPEKSRTGTLTAVAKSSMNTSMCFQNTFGSGDATDTQVLWFTLENQNIAGEYHWLPAFKDKRTGTFTGQLDNNGEADVVYHFIQEGQEDTQSLHLVFSSQSIKIIGAEPSLGINADIHRVECETIPGANQ
ncbi:hypothetical protein TDB9533_04666 [Thalassocella blandensis]|nr:hypothetical protein TDB9533_04666 [Thalassocella blandensis]